MSDGEGFLARWSRRKRGADADEPPASPATPPAAPVTPPADPPRAGGATPQASAGAPVAPAAPPAPAAAPPPAPTLEDVAALDADADITRFVARGVDPTVRNAALKKLFADPRWNVMDGLDVYIDDYGRPDPLPAGMLRQMAQARSLGLFREEEETPAAAIPAPADNLAAGPPAPVPAPEPPADEDAAVRLQPDDDAGRAVDPRRAGEDAGREP